MFAETIVIYTRYISVLVIITPLVFLKRT